MEGRRAGAGVGQGVSFLWGEAGQASRRQRESPMLGRFAVWQGEYMAHDSPPVAVRDGSQLELFGGDPASSTGPNPDQMREFLHNLLAEARSAQIMPWPPVNVRLYRTLFPQMTFWLPESEGAQLRFEFETELERLMAA